MEKIKLMTVTYQGLPVISQDDPVGQLSLAINQPFIVSKFNEDFPSSTLFVHVFLCHNRIKLMAHYVI